MSIFSSIKKTSPFFLIALVLLFLFPVLASLLILFSKWPHPFYTFFKELRSTFFQKKGLFGNTFYQPQGEKLFSIDLSDRPHIIFITLESFRAKNIGVINPKEGISPHFDRLANDGVLFTKFHATGNLTAQSMVASLLGINADNSRRDLEPYSEIALEGLPQVLSLLGYNLSLIQGGSIFFSGEKTFLKGQGFQTIIGKNEINQKSTSWGVFDEYLMEYAATWLEKQEKATFLHLHTITNHHPWIHPDGKTGYLHTFAYTDECLGRFVENLRGKDLLKKSILFIFGDHGQTSQGSTNRFLTQEILNVPLLIYASGRIKASMKIDTVSSQLDLLPTLCDLLHIKSPSHVLGKSLVRASSAPIFFRCGFDRTFYGCREGEWKYLKKDQEEELFHLLDDPEEKKNLVARDLPILSHLRKISKNHFDKVSIGYLGKNVPSTLDHLDFSGALWLNDEKLIEIAKKNQDLSSINLANCHLITDMGIKELFRLCPKIEALSIEGLIDVTADTWERLEYLTYLHAKNCPKLNFTWVESLPNLKVLHIDPSFLEESNLSIYEKIKIKLEE